MGKKIERIIDPETGKVTAEKHIVSIGPLHYQYTVKSKLELVLLRIVLICFFADIVFGVILLFSPEVFGKYLSIPFVISSALMYICAMICICVQKGYAKKKS